MRVDHTFLTPEECLRTTPWGEDIPPGRPEPGTFTDEGFLCHGNEHIAPYGRADDENPKRIKGGIAPGDSGGPLLAPILGGWGQIGIHSGLGGTDLPARATRTSFFQVFPATDTSDFAGSVRCVAGGEGRFTAVALEMASGTRIFTTLPVVPVPESTVRE